MYPDSMLGVKIVVRLYVIVTGLVLLVFRRCPWPVNYPLYTAVSRLSWTTKADYQVERTNYRFFHGLEMEGVELNEPYYYYYRTIALKYGWPYIKEVYDNQEFETPQPPTGKVPNYEPFRYFLKGQGIETLRLSHAKYLWWVLDAIICVIAFCTNWVNGTAAGDSLAMVLFENILLVAFIQMFFVGPLLLGKSIFWTARKTR